MEIEMDKDYYLTRMSASLDMARNAANSKVRLVHLDLAGRYSVAAAVEDHRSRSVSIGC